MISTGREVRAPQDPDPAAALAFTATKGTRQLRVDVLRDVRGWELRAWEQDELRRSQVVKTFPDFEALLEDWSQRLAADGWAVAPAD